MKYKCTICGYIYDEEVEEMKFEDLPAEWTCPLCGWWHPRLYWKAALTGYAYDTRRTVPTWKPPFFCVEKYLQNITSQPLRALHQP